VILNLSRKVYLADIWFYGWAFYEMSGGAGF
jgi:hypothetical protein